MLFAETFKRFFKTVSDVLGAVAGSKDAQKRLTDAVEKSQQAFADIFTSDWSLRTEKEKDEAIAGVKETVLHTLIPAAGTLSLMGAPGILVYTPCQIAGAIAIAYIRSTKRSLMDSKNLMTIAAVLFWGKAGQITFQTLFHLFSNVLPLPAGIGIAVLPFVQEWTRLALNKVDDYYHEATQSPESSPLPRQNEMQELHAEDALLNDVTKQAEKMVKTLARGGKILFEAQQEVVNELCEGGDDASAIELGRTHLFHGVAGSGKTIIMTQLVPRLVEAFLAEQRREPLILVYHFNNYVRTMLKREIVSVLKAGRPDVKDYDQLFDRLVQIHTLSTLHDELALGGHLFDETVRRVHVAPGENPNPQRAAAIRSALKTRAGLFDIILIDEGQDVDEEEYRLLFDLCRSNSVDENDETGKSVFIFYDDCQAIYGAENGLRDRLPIPIVQDNEHLLTKCIRSSKKIIDFTVNTCINPELSVDDRERLASALKINKLRRRNLVTVEIPPKNSWIDCRFCVFPGEEIPELRIFKNNSEMIEALGDSVQQIRAEIEGYRFEGSILILCVKQEMVSRVSDALCQKIGEDNVRKRSGRHATREHKLENLAVETSLVNVATIGDAKGYDADIVFIINPDGIGKDASEIDKRLKFYVAATRAKQFLAVYSSIQGKPTIVRHAARALEIMRHK